jgi:Protein of unknown function (DUF3891)
MILCALGEQPAHTPASDNSAWHLIEESQRRVAPPLLLIPQPSHAVLAGDLAEALLPDAFGELPATILRAIRMHDTGWGSLDAAQIHQVRDVGGRKDDKGHRSSPAAGLVSFIDVPSSEAVGAWKASVDEAEKISPECGFIVSRHFSLLAVRGDRAHATFSKQEAARRERIVRSSKPDPSDMERWTDALGFCDLLSLYLCSGVSTEASLARVHPARRTDTPALCIRRNGEEVILSQPLIRKGTRVQIHGLLHPAPAAGSAAQGMGWIFA